MVLANAKNDAITIAPKTYNAQAAGAVYLDDGVSATDIGRYDVAIILKDDKTVEIDFTTVKDLKTKNIGNAATISTISFLWASQTGYKGTFKTAKLIEASGASVDLNPP